jgi:hypothetical protein
MIEKNISQYVEKQFPAFYQDEGPQFIAFVKAYYEWLEQPDNVTYKARHLLEYRDIDTTLDEFILYFKEKYLKNIQFDTATNKKLLVKHSLDLYRSKGTERSIDLFFKLVFGTAAEVQYPGERIFKLSDGVWELPRYLEVTYNKFNLNYVGRQIIGSASGATAFVERYIRRRAGYGYVNLLYISNQVGTFTRGEVIGVQSSGRSVYTPGQTATIIGSIESVIIQDNGRNFAVGDIVNFLHSNRGVGGQARVTSIGENSGIIDFILNDGGWGYTTNATSIVSEKVATANGVVGTIGANQITLFDLAIQPTISVDFTTGPQIALGDIVGRYDGANLIANGQVIEIEQVSGNATGTMTISVNKGPFTEGTLYVNGNTTSLNATAIVDTSTYADIMGIPSVYQLSIANTNGVFSVGMNVYQTVSNTIYSHGTVSGVNDTFLLISAGVGNFSNGAPLIVSGNSSVNAVVTQVDTTIGLYNINKRAYSLDFISANNDGIANSQYLFQYDAFANVVSSGLALHSSVSSNTGTIEYVPMQGQFQLYLPIYTVGNTARASVSDRSSPVTGGDFVESANASWRTAYTNTTFTVSSLSEGTGAQFDVGTIGETEVLYLGTDIISANSTSRLSFDRRRVDVTSSAGFQIGDLVTQVTNTSLIAAGTVSAVQSATLLRIVDNYGTFGPSGGANGNIVVYSNNAVNTAVTAVSFVAAQLTLDASPYLYLPLRAASYGFPKNPQGNYADIIFDCLSFDRFEVGTIESLAGVDPGSGYNVDPYVLVEQPEIAGFQRRDYVFNVSNSSSSFINGEKINQVAANLTTYTLTVDYGTSNTLYTSRQVRVNALQEINATPDFIYARDSAINIIPGEVVNPFTESIEATNEYVVGDMVRYQTGTSNVAIVANNTFALIDEANSSAFSLNVAITITSNTFNPNTIVNNFISIASNPYANDLPLRYVVALGNTATLGISNNEVYYAVEANSTGLRLSETLAGAVLTLSPGASETGHALVSTLPLSNGHVITLYRNPFSDGERVFYEIATGNTAISGLSNTTAYYVVQANSIGFKVSATYGGANINITAGSSEVGHYFNSIPGWLPLEGVYSNSGAYGVIDSVGNGSIVVKSVSNGTFAAPGSLSSNTNAYLTANVATSTLSTITQTSEGIVKSSNTTALVVKRIQFENNWASNTTITGEVSGATAVLDSIDIDMLSLPVGLNANVEANVITAEGQVTSLKIIDSGFGYVNSEIVQFTSVDGLRAASAKVILGGVGKGAGYYKSSKGFLSDSVCLHDGDYYQEYSYEIFSKLSVDRYSDMFKKVMHTAGTKFFGSARVVEEDAVVVTLTESSVVQE